MRPRITTLEQDPTSFNKFTLQIQQKTSCSLFPAGNSAWKTLFDSAVRYGDRNSLVRVIQVSSVCERPEQYRQWLEDGLSMLKNLLINPCLTEEEINILSREERIQKKYLLEYYTELWMCNWLWCLEALPAGVKNPLDRSLLLANLFPSNSKHWKLFFRVSAVWASTETLMQLMVVIQRHNESCPSYDQYLHEAIRTIQRILRQQQSDIEKNLLLSRLQLIEEAFFSLKKWPVARYLSSYLVNDLLEPLIPWKPAINVLDILITEFFTREYWHVLHALIKNFATQLRVASNIPNELVPFVTKLLARLWFIVQTNILTAAKSTAFWTAIHELSYFSGIEIIDSIISDPKQKAFMVATRENYQIQQEAPETIFSSFAFPPEQNPLAEQGQALLASRNNIVALAQKFVISNFKEDMAAFRGFLMGFPKIWITEAWVKPIQCTFSCTILPNDDLISVKSPAPGKGTVSISGTNFFQIVIAHLKTILLIENYIENSPNTHTPNTHTIVIFWNPFVKKSSLDTLYLHKLLWERSISGHQPKKTTGKSPLLPLPYTNDELLGRSGFLSRTLHIFDKAFKEFFMVRTFKVVHNPEVNSIELTLALDTPTPQTGFPYHFEFQRFILSLDQCAAYADTFIATLCKQLEVCGSCQYSKNDQDIIFTVVLASPDKLAVVFKDFKAALIGALWCDSPTYQEAFAHHKQSCLQPIARKESAQQGAPDSLFCAPGTALQPGTAAPAWHPFSLFKYPITDPDTKQVTVVCSGSPLRIGDNQPVHWWRAVP